jgi:dipeptide/tripeptide permease
MISVIMGSYTFSSFQFSHLMQSAAVTLAFGFCAFSICSYCIKPDECQKLEIQKNFSEQDKKETHLHEKIMTGLLLILYFLVIMFIFVSINNIYENLDSFFEKILNITKLLRF